jgi:hypothetical protein
VKSEVRTSKSEVRTCSRWREAIRLELSGASESAQMDSLQRHLANCEGCRRYADDLQRVATGLRGLADQRAEPSPGLRARWTQAVEQAAEPISMGQAAAALFARFCGLLQQNLRPALAVASLWFIALLLRVTAPDVSPATQTAAARSPVEIFQALRASGQLLANAPRQFVPAALVPHKARSTHPRTEGLPLAPSALWERERQWPAGGLALCRSAVLNEHPTQPFNV